MGGALLLLMLGSFQLGAAKDVAINDGFELTTTAYWTEYGAVFQFIDYFDVNGNGTANYALASHPGTSSDGGVTQLVYMMANQPYTITIDIAYYNC